MEGQTQDLEATRRPPRQYQAEVHEASVDETADDDQYGDGNQPQSVPLGFGDGQAQEAGNPQWIADHVTEEPIDLAQEPEPNSSGHQQPTTTRNNNLVKQEIVYLCDHRDFRSVFPFEQCSSREATTQLWEDMYANSDLNYQDKQSYLNKLVNGEYRIETLANVPILPSTWETLVRPNSTIKIVFTNLSRSYSRRQSRSQPQRTSHLEAGASSSRNDLAVSIEVVGSVSPSEESESSIITEDDSSDNETSSNEEDTRLRDPLSLRPNPYVLNPVDVEGNRISFQVKTNLPSSIVTPSEQSESPENKKAVRSGKNEPRDSNLEIRRITKAMTLQSDAQNILVLHTLPSLANPRLRACVATTWYHLHGTILEFDRFENVCLNIPHLSDRLQALTREVLTKLRDDKIKPFVGGKFIEPGTVLRADEANPTDSQSVIFSCVPYFSLQQVAKPSPEHRDLLCPPRTLMQALYPYESVRERDDEQSYRRFGNDPTNSIIHVPSLWIMNIGSTAVVTYGHEPLSVAMKGSVSIDEEDIMRLGKQGITENTLSKIHITDRVGSSFIYPIGSFRSYFQLESRIIHSDPVLEGRVFEKGIKLKVQNLDEDTMVSPRNWKSIISRATQLVSISITILDAQRGDRRDEEASTSDSAAIESPISVPPFFHWLHSKTNDLSHRGGKPVVPGISEKDRSIMCLEYVEKVMMSRYLARSASAVEDAFTSTNYYHFLPETLHGGVTTRLSELQDLISTTTPPESGFINHKLVVSTHCRGILVQSVKFLETVQKTLHLFVDDLDSSSILRKLSSALQNVHQQAMTIEERGPLETDPEEYTNSKWVHPDMMKRAWSIRTSAWKFPLSLPDSKKALQRSVLRCRRCRSPFKSAISAITHLVRHVKKYSPVTPHPDEDIPSFKELQDWIINSVQYRRELTNASALVILTHASEIAGDLFVRARDLAEGVQNEDGKMSSLYTLPQELIHAFRRIVIFYLAIERALHENEKAYGQDVRYQSSRRLTNAPYSWRDTDVLKRFGGYARQSLCKARILLCDMVRPESSLSLRKHLSLGPEYVSLWFMKTLLMRSLEQSKTIGDMYHVYVSKVQFEINHRPSKRLLRAINLIEEELQVLELVNAWQTNLVHDFLGVLDDDTYENIIPTRRAIYPHEYNLGMACLDHLSLVRQDFADLIRRCAPLSDRTKQILEINEEDHGKAIMVFTVVTVIFLPLSFVTSYFGMNASDIRDMDETQAVFWSVALPLTCVTVGSCLLIGYNGDSIRDILSSMYRKMMRKERDTVEAAGITVSQRLGPSKSQGRLDSIFESFGPTDDEVLSRRQYYYSRYYDDDDIDEWYEKEPRLLDQYNTSIYPSRPYPSGITPKRQNSYPDPVSVAVQPRRQSLYPYSYPTGRRPSLNDYERTPYTPYKEAARDRPRRTGRTQSRYANSSNPFIPISPINAVNRYTPYKDGGCPSSLANYRIRSSVPYYQPHLPPPPPPRRTSTSEVIHRSRRGHFGIEEDEPFTRGGGVEKRYGNSRRDRSRSRSRSRSRGGSWDYAKPAHHVHYENGPVESGRYRSPGRYYDSYGADRVSSLTRREEEHQNKKREDEDDMSLYE